MPIMMLTDQEWTWYCKKASEFRVYPQHSALYLPLGLGNESGEFLGKRKKEIRDQKVVKANEAIDELGDILWYIANICTDADCHSIPGKFRSCYEIQTDTQMKRALEPSWLGVDWYFDDLCIRMHYSCATVAEQRRRMIDAGYSHDSGLLYNIPKAMAWVAILGWQVDKRTIVEIMARNIEKLTARQTLGTLHGEGDNR